MSEDDARWIFQQLIVAVDYCHRLGIANRDIKVHCMHLCYMHCGWVLPSACMRRERGCTLAVRQGFNWHAALRPVSLHADMTLPTLECHVLSWSQLYWKVSDALLLPIAQLDNMLLHGPWPRPQLKLCDFGFSKNEVVQSVSKSTCGTPEYMAPEVGTVSPSCQQLVTRCPCA